MADVVWLNGALLAEDQASVSVFDHGLTVGDGVFETIKAVNGAPFALQRHLDRLRTSASALGLAVPFTDAALAVAVADVLENRGLPLARVRITVTGGVAPLGSERADNAPTVVVAAGTMTEAPLTTSVCLVPWTRNERSALAGVKSTSYAENVIALAHARARGHSEALFANSAGNLCEGTGSNVFVAIDGQLITPPLSSGCLAGVTRALVIESTQVVEADIPVSDLIRAQELFLTSTGRDVQAVHQVDDRALPAPGPLTTAAGRAFAAHSGR